LPIDPARKCPDGPGDHCGASDFYNSPAVLPNMDNLNPHLTASLNMLYTWQVTLPNVECTNCTLQVIQVMEDDGAHGPYDPTPGVGVEDIYHQCIDLVLKRPDGGTGSTDAGTGGDGRPPTVDAGTGTGGAPGTDAATPRDSGSTGMGGTAGTGGTGTGGTGTGGTGTGGTGTGGTGTGGTGTGTGGTGAGGNGTGTGGSGGTSSGGSGGANPGGTGGTNGGGSAGANTGGNTPAEPADGGRCNISRTSTHFSAGAAWSLLALALASRRRRR
jgi:MYXO-CTERM domain-containing protein